MQRENKSNFIVIWAECGKCGNGNGKWKFNEGRLP